MGYDELPNLNTYNFSNFSAGWFPGRDMNEIPGSLDNPNQPIGAEDADNMIWLNGELIKFYGFSKINTIQLNGGSNVHSIFYASSIPENFANVGDKIYRDIDSATPTDVTGAVFISADLPLKWVEWEFDNDKLIIASNGNDPMIKSDGTAAFSLLGGSPPLAKWLVPWQNVLFASNIATNQNGVFFSNIGDPEVWSSGDDYQFDAPITGMEVLGDKLVVFKERSIGILSGTNVRALTKVDKFIENVGCSGGNTIQRCRLGNRDVLIFHSYDGFYAFDGSKNIIKLSNPIKQKYVDGSNITRWNENRFSEAYSTYSPTQGWYYCALSDGDDATKNDFIVILDLNRVYDDEMGVYVPHWPLDNVNARSISLIRTTQYVENVYFGDENGFIYKFDPAVYDRDGQVYTGYFKSKIFDPVQSWILQEANVIGINSNAVIDVCINSDLRAGDGECDDVTLTQDADLLDIDFFMDLSYLSGNLFVFKNAEIYNFGRFIQFKLSNDVLDDEVKIQRFNLILQYIGVDPIVGRV